MPRTFGGSDADGARPAGHVVTQLQPQFSRQLPELMARLRALAVQADAERGWGLIEAARLVPRTIELLAYSGGHGSGLGWHMDKQSAVTLLAMLSEPDEYAGGALQHEHAGRVTSVALRKGDVAVYRSNQRHRVTKTTAGRRVTLAVEFWHVDPRSVVSQSVVGDGRPVLVDALAPYFDVCPR